MHPFCEVIFDEMAALPRRIGGRSGILMWIFAIVVMGVLLSWQLGYGFLDMPVLLAYAAMPLLFAAPLVAESFAAERARHPVPADRRLPRDLLPATAPLGGLDVWASTRRLMALGFMAVNLHYR